ncbi:MAG TPA: energy transducer TonB [Chitinophagaceae bacterium]|jgi:protein TonB
MDFGQKELLYENKLLMDANKILSADVLDILFEGRNKAYGAYDLRKTYRQRLGRALLLMLAFLLLLFGANFLFGFIKPSNTKPIVEREITLEELKTPQEKKVIVPPPPPPPKPPPPVNMRQFTNHMIIEKDPPEAEKPPPMDDLDRVKIGTANVTNGTDAPDIVVPEGRGKGIIDVPQKTEPDAPFMKVEKESEYPGGPNAWRKFLERNLYNNLPQEAVDQGIQGSVVIRFIVDIDGTVSDVTPISGPKEYQAAAINVIRKSGKWTPALQNGRQVKSYKSQMITIKLEDNP